MPPPRLIVVAPWPLTTPCRGHPGSSAVFQKVSYVQGPVFQRHSPHYPNESYVACTVHKGAS